MSWVVRDTADNTYLGDEKRPVGGLWHEDPVLFDTLDRASIQRALKVAIHPVYGDGRLVVEREGALSSSDCVPATPDTLRSVRGSDDEPPPAQRVPEFDDEPESIDEPISFALTALDEVEEAIQREFTWRVDGVEVQLLQDDSLASISIDACVEVLSKNDVRALIKVLREVEERIEDEET